MPKFILIGHPLSGYQAIESLLRQHGMADAQPTQRDKFTPAAISALLCKAHEHTPLSTTQSAANPLLPAPLQQIDVAPAWNGLVMDLLLSNLEQATFWGWSDPHAIHLLEYWKQQDPALKFVFVYNTPETAFAFSAQEAAQAGAEAGVAAIDAQASQWHAFNAALLHFFNRNRERCVLIHAGQAQASRTEADLSQLGQLLDAPLKALAGAPAEAAQAAPEGDASARSTAIVATEAAVTAGNLHPQLPLELSGPANTLESYLASQLAAQYPYLQQLYEELQSVANWPIPQDQQATTHLDAKHAWLANLAGIQRLQHKEQELQDARQDIHQLQLDHATQTITRENELEEARKDIRQLQLDHATKTGAKEKELEEENELLLGQLHKVQEELERYYLKLKALEKIPGDAQQATGAGNGAAALTPAVAARNQPGGKRKLISRAVDQMKARAQARLIARSEEFDATWYLAQNPDVARLRVFAKNPALHYLLHGVDEQRNPAPGFSSWTYLRRYPDVRALGINPFLHYIRHGKAEGRHGK